jgi:hypothetical protein
MALPPGTLNGHTLAVLTTGEAGSEELSYLLVAVGSELVEIDIGLARRAIDDDAWGYEQLVQLTDAAEPSAVGKMIGGAPHCLNIRDAETGNTLLHHCADTGNEALAAVCLAPEGAVFVPIANSEGKTALHVAFERREPSVARVIAESLTPHLNDVMAALLTGALRAAALTMPEAVLPLLNAIEATVLVEHAATRTLHRRTEVIGLAEPALIPLDPGRKDLELFESERAGAGLGSAAGLDLAPWNKIFPSADKHAMHTLVAFKTIMLAGLAADPADTGGASAFHLVVANCDASVFESKLLQYLVQYKFETNVLPMLRHEVVLFSGATLLASVAMLASSRQLEGGSDSNWVYIDVAQVRLDGLAGFRTIVAHIVIDTIVFYRCVWECWQHFQQALVTHEASPKKKY